MESLPWNYKETDVQEDLKPFCNVDGHNICNYHYNNILNSIPSEGNNILDTFVLGILMIL